jgi:transcriptional regulator with XRE-family HTH domain
MNSPRVDFLSVINGVMLRRGISQAALAKMVGAYPGQMSNWLSGKVQMPVGKLEEILAALGVGFGEATPPSEIDLLTYAIDRSGIAPEMKSILTGLLRANASQLTTLRPSLSAVLGIGLTTVKDDKASG